MASTNVRGGQILDGTVSRVDLNTNGPANTCVVAKVLATAPISISSSGGDAGTGDATVQLTGTVPIANGGTAQTTALAARGIGGINVESRSTFTDANYTGLATDRYIASTATVFTASRTVTLPAANALNAGAMLYIGDDGGAITSAFTLSIARAGTDTIHGGTASIVLFSPRSSVILETDGASNWTVVSRSPAVRRQVLTTGTTFTTTVGAKAMWVECIGGGGGGGGALGGSSQCGLGGGGGSGGYAAIYIVNPKASYTYAIGGGGAGGVGASVGSVGTATTFDSPAVCTASGGGAGLNLVTGTTNTWVGPNAQSITSVGDLTLTSVGSYGLRMSGLIGISGQGSAAPRGGGMSGARNTQADGLAGQLYGGGGGGACSFSTTSQTGGPGAAGVIIVTEFF